MTDGQSCHFLQKGGMKMDKSEFDKIASEIIAKGLEKMAERINSSTHELSDRELIQIAYANAVATSRDMLFEYHQKLEEYLKTRLP